MHASQEFSGLSTLDDAMVVGRGERRHLGDTQLRYSSGRVALVGGGIVNRSNPEDHALARHEASDGVIGAKATRVRQGGGNPLEIVDGQLISAPLSDDLLVSSPEIKEVHLLGALDSRHNQLARSIRGNDVDGHAEVDLMVFDEVRFTVNLGICIVHGGHRFEGLDHGISQDMGEGNLAAFGLLKEGVDHGALLDDQLHRYVTYRRGCRHG